MELRPIKTETDYQNALTEIERLFDASPDSPELDRLDILTTLVSAKEQQHYPIDAPDPISAIKYYLEARGLSPWRFGSVNWQYGTSNGNLKQTTAIEFRYYPTLKSGFWR